MLTCPKVRELDSTHLARELVATASLMIMAATVALAGIGCCPSPSSSAPLTRPSAATAPPGPQPDATAVRSVCTDAWAKKLLGDEYTTFRACSPADRRKNVFASVFERIDRASRRERISGNQCLDLLGPPDYWAQPPSGEILLIYLYTFNGQNMSALIALDRDGYIKHCGTNRADAMQFGPEFHHG